MTGAISTVIGDLLTVETQYIAHQCNCVTTHGAGLSRSLFARFPWADSYTGRRQPSQPGTIEVFGDGHDQRFVINLYAQYNPGKPRKSEDSAEQRRTWFTECLEQVKQTPELQEIAFPEGIGCGLAGGDWKLYSKILENWAAENPSISVFLIQRAV